jgi:hypothetical protein
MPTTLSGVADTPDSPVPKTVNQLRTPEKWTAGVYANGLGVWSTQTEVTLDFIVNLPPEQATDQEGSPVAVIPQEVVARVKIPPPLLFQIMRNLAGAQDAYEAQWGSIPDYQAQGGNAG